VAALCAEVFLIIIYAIRVSVRLSWTRFTKNVRGQARACVLLLLLLLLFLRNNGPEIPDAQKQYEKPRDDQQSLMPRN